MNKQTAYLSFAFFLGWTCAEAQIKIRKIVKDADSIPSQADATFDGIQRSTIQANGLVVFHATRRVDNFSAGAVAAVWDRYTLQPQLTTGDVPPALPSSFRNDSGNVHTMPLITSPTFGVLTSYENYWFLETRIRDVGVNGSERAILAGQSGGNPYFYGGVTSATLGVAGRSGEIILKTTEVERIGFNRVTHTPFLNGRQAHQLDPGVVFSNATSAGINWNADGRMVYLGTVSGPGIASTNSTVLYREFERPVKGVELIAQQGGHHPAAPGLALGGHFINLNINTQTSINNHGTLAFNATITDPGNPSATVDSIWRVASEGDFDLILRAATPVAVTNQTPITFSFLSAPVISSEGDILFRGNWNDGAFHVGLFRYVQASGVIQLEYKNGTPIPGSITGLTLEYLTHHQVSTNGRVAAMVGLRKLNGTIRPALIAQRADGSYHAVAIQNELLSLSGGGNAGTISSISPPLFTPFSNGEDSKPTAYSSSGRLIFEVVNQSTSQEWLIAADVDFVSILARFVGAPAGVTSSWDEPQEFAASMVTELAEVTAAQVSLATLPDPLDLTALTNLSSDQVTTLRSIPKFHGDDRGFATVYLTARENLLNVIEVIAIENPQMAAWLLESFRAGRIQFGDKKGNKDAFASIYADRLAACGDEPITLYFIPSESLAVHHPDFVQLVNSLMHEAQHAFQTFPSLAENHTEVEQAMWARDRHANEIEASCGELLRIGDLERALDNLEGSDMADHIVESLNQLSGQALIDARKALLGRLRELKHNAANTKECRDEYVEALERFFMFGGHGDKDRLHQELKENYWFKQKKDTNTEFGKIVYTGGGASYNAGSNRMEGNTTFHQIESETGVETTFTPGTNPEFVHDAILNAAGDRLYVAVKEASASKLYCYQDTDQDGHFEKASEVEVGSIPPERFGLHLHIQDDGRITASSATTVYNMVTPVQVIGMIQPGDPILVMKNVNGVLEGSPLGENDAITTDLRVTRLFPENSLSYGDQTLTPLNNDFLLPPGFSKAPVSGDTLVTVHGDPRSRVELIRMDAMGIEEVVGSGIIDEEGLTTISISPLTPTETLQLRDPDSGKRSLRIKAWNAADLMPKVTDLYKNDEGFWIESTGIPGKDYEATEAPNIEDTIWSGNAFTNGGYGKYWRFIDPNTGFDTRYFRVESSD